MSEPLTIDAAREWVDHYRNSASVTLPPKQAVDALEFVLLNLDASELHNSLLRKALNKWKTYFQNEAPITPDQKEQSGEEFTDAWFEMEEALGTDGGKDVNNLRAKLAAAEAELSAMRIEFAKRENSTDWQLGGIAMLRSMKATLQLLREGRWTLEQAEQWVNEQLE